ncbi:MAG TPA: hypothetical protein VF763_14080 [Candidatus Limnocylindrales bacterium]
MPDVEYAFLADAAEAVPGQKFSILGGGISRLAGRTFPLQHPHLALVVGLRVTAVEHDREHALRFVLLAPDGNEVASAEGNVVAHGQGDGRDNVVTFAIDLWNLVLPAPGEYSLRVLVAGSERKRLPLVVTPIVETPPPPEQRYLA